MSIGSVGLARPATAAARSSPRAYAAQRFDDWAAASSDWTGLGTAFQGRVWLDAWYAAMAARPDVSPCLVVVRDAATREVAFRLPLILREEGQRLVIEFADLNLTDFNSPLLGPASPRDRTEAARALRAVRRVLPKADILRLAKMPPTIAGRANPLTLLRSAVPSALNGNLVETGEDVDAWRRSLGRTYRKELERSWRVFMRGENAAFNRIEEPSEAHALLEVLEAQQGDRIRSLGRDYVLDDPAFSRVYHGIVERGIGDGSVVMTSLTAEGEVVASLLGLREGDTYTMIRISQAGGRWSNCSPGRLIIERTLTMLHGQGCRKFDFSIGNYEYKRRFQTVPTQLFDCVLPLSPRGLRAAARAFVVGRLRNHPALDARLRSLSARFKGNPPAQPAPAAESEATASTP